MEVFFEFSFGACFSRFLGRFLGVYGHRFFTVSQAFRKECIRPAEYALSLKSGRFVCARRSAQTKKISECIRPIRFLLNFELIRPKFECIRPKFELIRPKFGLAGLKYSSLFGQRPFRDSFASYLLCVACLIIPNPSRKSLHSSTPDEWAREIV